MSWILIILMFDQPMDRGEVGKVAQWQTHSEMEFNDKGTCEEAKKHFQWPEGMMGTLYCERSQ